MYNVIHMRLLFFLISISLYSNSLYGAESLPLGELLAQRVAEDPFRLCTVLLFLGAILHTFLAGKFVEISHRIEKQKGTSTYVSKLLHFLGEVEVVFAVWLLPLILSFICFKGWNATVEYFETRHYTEPIFVVVIMTIASTKPILYLSEQIIRLIVRLFGKESPAIWWLIILLIAPLLGSLITEPAAMTIGAMLLSKQVFKHQISVPFAYATLGLLFVSVSVGGVLTNFAAPPVLMVASRWNWSTSFMFKHFGLESILGIVVATLVYVLFFAKQLYRLHKQHSTQAEKNEENMPLGMIFFHVLFLGWTVLNAHHVAFLIWGFLAFLVFANMTQRYQNPIALRGALLVGCFLAGLVTHGGLQEWWIQAVLSRLNESLLFYGSVFLTAFNDNASITYLASLVPEFENNFALQYSVVSGAVVGGGLTVIANAPNPAGQSLLAKYFPNGIVKPLPLLLGALLPTIFLVLSFRLASQ